jgi:PPK2 family polyphosphate:nucleotide phosphotransferase
MLKQSDFLVRPGSRPRLKNYATDSTAGFAGEREAAGKIESDCRELARLQDMLMAEETHALLVVFQSIDGSGKDGTIKHVASTLDPQGCTAVNFKKPSEIENRHDYLWRFHHQVPERGRITFFNRSYYEEVISPRVHPERLAEQKLPRAARGPGVWKKRMAEINGFEQYLVDNGVAVLKFFLHLSKRKQAERLLERTEERDKMWKFSAADMENRDLWLKHYRAHEEMLAGTSTRAAPWYVIPADRRWFTALAVADLMVRKLRTLRPRYPTVETGDRQAMQKARRRLKREL